MSAPLLLAENSFPPSPYQSWAPPKLGDYEAQLAAGRGAYESNSLGLRADTNIVYDLPALIDIAERAHPQTRVAWERARQAAGAVGLSESTYYPYLAASATAGFQHELVAEGTVFPGNGVEENVALDVKWLLFDFGARKAQVTAAREQLMAANVGFNAAHQQIVFAVTKSFYDFNTARQKVGVAESALQAATAVGEAAQARYENGLATRPNVLQAEQQTAQAVFDLDAARGKFGDAQVTLVQSLGIVPTTQLQIADVAEKHFDENFADPLDQLIDRALSERPDLVAKLASLRARQAQVRLARAAYYPKISLEGSAGWEKLDVNAYNSPYTGNSKPVYGIGLAIDLPLFEGFARVHRLRIAESQLREAENELADSRDRAVSEVWRAYTDLKTALRQQESADKLLTAAQSAFDASLEAYQHGLGTYVDTQSAQRNLTAAHSAVVDTRSSIFTAAAALAFSMGDLARPLSMTHTTMTHTNQP
ncbi:MAG TPA: TolC family protein [Candidatus Acidoferrales bacterium]|nr:TolC family protein [Candidatus Acidoferrales bacterium]